MTYEIEVRDFPAQPIVTIRRTCKMADIQKTLAEILPATFGYVLQEGAQPAGPPFTMYHSHGDDVIDLEGGCPTAAPPARWLHSWQPAKTAPTRSAAYRPRARMTIW